METMITCYHFFKLGFLVLERRNTSRLVQVWSSWLFCFSPLFLRVSEVNSFLVQKNKVYSCSFVED